MCTRQSREIICDMISTLFLTTAAVKNTLLLFISTRKHMSVAYRTILSNFFEEQCCQNHPQYLSGSSSPLFPTTVLETAVCDAPLSRSARRSFAGYRNRAKITVLMCEQKPFSYGFRAGGRAFRYAVNCRLADTRSNGHPTDNTDNC